MDETTRTHLANLRSKDRAVQNTAYTYLMAATEEDLKYRKKYARLWPKGE